MQYPLHNNLTKYIYVHVYYMTAKVNSFYSFDLYYKEMQKWFLFCLFFFLTKHTGILYTYAMTSKLKLITERVIKSSLFNKNRRRQGNSAGQRIQESHTSKNSLPIKNHALSDDHKKRVQIWCSRLQLKVFDQELFKLWQRSIYHHSTFIPLHKTYTPLPL